MPYPVFVDGRSLWTTLRLNGELRLLEDGPDRTVIEEGPARLNAAFLATLAALALTTFPLPYVAFAALSLTLSALERASSTTSTLDTRQNRLTLRRHLGPLHYDIHRAADQIEEVFILRRTTGNGLACLLKNGKTSPLSFCFDSREDLDEITTILNHHLQSWRAGAR